MDITRVSQLSGKTHTLSIDVTPEEIATWETGVLIQVAMPNVSREDREFIKLGITPAEWDEAFKEDEDCN